MKKIIILLIAFSNLANLFSQVGINIQQPHASAMLHVNSTDKGLLIPALRSLDRASIANPADGLMVYDTDLNAIVTYNKDSVSWMIDLFRAKINSAGQLTGNVVISNTMLNAKRIGIGTTNPSSMLHVAGTVTVNALSTTGNITANSLTASSINAGGVITAASYTNNLHGNGPVPAGGIIMWSGAANNIPVGWALCDGNNNTPDLRNRFIVGAGSDVGTYTPGTDNIGTGTYKPNDKGGQDFHKLILNEIPSHTHGVSTGHVAGDGWGNGPTPVFGISDKIGSTGVDTPHENRPPFYALAYIMKLP